MTQETETNLETTALPVIQGVPIGTILPYGGDVYASSVRVSLANQGWLVCDGEQYDVTDYPDLSQVIGFFFGGNLRNQFNVPDLRGMFLRGVDGGAGKDPDAKSRVALVNGGNTGDNVGSYQQDEFKTHNHKIMLWPRSFRGADGDDKPYDNQGSVDGSTSDSGGNETRPKNIYVNYIIKAKNV
ncbi:MAG: tail fiber protein [Microcystis novacekii Mn_MB_F_20050700_S1]|uniref:Tail fiber protein n=1 Tax=Microcystis novacekii Mn_MB_F_20050700_S1D TaxID=2486266 RepID=A0A552J273_9CHRO|nr:MAG: tail fiber protein [Microcystis novacekii Mn_MB_F_20050700_S1]TRU89849.1 MAG: tail fiber protein [Microcystis novacekii Mn_MB_F_20050700_S1D]